MTHHFKISFWGIIKGLFVHIFFFFLLLIFSLVKYFQDKLDSYFIWFSIIAILIVTLPSLILLINHLYKSYNIELTIDYNEQIIKIIKGSNVFKYKKGQLHKVTHVKTTSYPLIYDFTIFWSVFGYFKFEFNDNKVFYLSSLAFNLKKIDYLKIDESDSLFPLILNC